MGCNTIYLCIPVAQVLQQYFYLLFIASGFDIGFLRRPDGQLRFQRLVRVAKLVLTMPHSNAAEERVFSMIRKNKTPFRPNLDPSETLGSIITIKMELEQRDPSRKFVFPPQLLSAAKSATRKTAKISNPKCLS